jgi:hypothetical protein
MGIEPTSEIDYSLMLPPQAIATNTITSGEAMSGEIMSGKVMSGETNT